MLKKSKEKKEQYNMVTADLRGNHKLEEVLKSIKETERGGE
jgi:hypothetical protein